MTIPAAPHPHPFLHGGGQMGELIAAHDWGATALGPLADWPGWLKNHVAMLLRSRVAIIILVGEGGVMIYNDSYRDIAGGRHPDILGAEVRAGWPEVAEFNDHVMKTCLGGGTLAFREQELVLLRSGVPERAWLNLDYSPLPDDQGRPAGVIVMLAEATSRVLAENAVRASEKLFRSMASSMPNQVWAAGADGRLDWFNQQVYSYSGKQEGELDGAGWTDIVHPGDVAAASVLWQAAVAAGRPYETEFRVRRHDGAWRWHLVRATPILGEHGAIVRWVGSNTDIQDQKEAAQLLLHMNEILEQQVQRRTAERDRMWQSSSDVMLVTRMDGTVVAVNPAFTRLLGWSAEDLVGRSALELIHPDDLDASRAELARLGRGESTFKFENRNRRKGGGYAILSWTAVAEQEFVHGVGRDMTAEREAAEEVRRTALALQQAQKMEAIGKLTGGVAHDFNNLLQVIAGNLQLLGADVAGQPAAARRVEQALAGVQRGAKLASYLLAFGRRQALDPRVVRIGRFIAGMEDMLRRSLGEAIEIRTEIADGLWNTLVDTAQVENAVLNLCINARDAMDGVGKLSIEVGNVLLDEQSVLEHPELRPGQYVMIAVSDTGSGMTPEVLEQAFDPFFSTKPEGKGTGLGLSMVYGFVRQSGGHVKIDSTPGQGTTVRLYLPRSFEAEDRSAQPEPQPVVGGDETILVAEDDEGVRATVVELLRGLGYTVLEAGDGAAALALLQDGAAVDLLFTDVVMPGPLRSPDLARLARESRPELAVLYTSGYAEDAIVHGGRLDPGVDLLGKPYTREALARKIRHVLANRRQRLQGAALLAEAASAAAQPAPAAIVAGAGPADAMPAAMPDAGAAAAIPAGGPDVLLVEDDPELRATTAELMELLGHPVLAAADAAGALELLRRHPVRLMLTDISLPDLGGEELARQARQLHPGLRIVFVSGQQPRVQLANSSVLLKPFSVDKLMGVLGATAS
ncbi:PAS domain S-box protein [Oxalobacteraceae bacterium A2-2]